jgi:hypothetical protein
MIPPLRHVSRIKTNRAPHVSRLKYGAFSPKSASAGLKLATIPALLLAVTASAHAQVLEGFNWVDLKTDTSTVTTVTKALEAQKYTALREIGLIGDQALVITATRGDLIAQPQQDRFNVYGISLKDGKVDPLLDGADLRIFDWQKFYDYDSPELLATYNDCNNCEPTTFLTAFYIDRFTKKWHARWPRSLAGAPLTATGSGGQSVYALLMNVDQRVVLDTWSRYSQQKKSSRGGEYLFEYRVDPVSDQGASRPLTGRDAAKTKLRLCAGESVVFGISGGQDSDACHNSANLTLKRPAAKASSHLPGPPTMQ